MEALVVVGGVPSEIHASLADVWCDASPDQVDSEESLELSSGGFEWDDPDEDDEDWDDEDDDEYDDFDDDDF